MKNFLQGVLEELNLKVDVDPVAVVDLMKDLVDFLKYLVDLKDLKKDLADVGQGGVVDLLLMS